MISLYSGTPGSGKSLHIAKRIYELLRYGYRVIANFPIDIEKVSKHDVDFLYIDNDQMTPKRLIQESMIYWQRKAERKGWSETRIKEDAILLVIDEAQILFNARAWQQSGRSEWNTFFTQHRKLGYEIVLIAQFDGMLDKQIRSLIEYNVIHRKVKNFGRAGFIINFLAMGGLFVAVKVWYPLNQPIGSEYFKSRKKYYSIYNTYSMFDAFGSDFKLEDKENVNNQKPGMADNCLPGICQS